MKSYMITEQQLSTVVACLQDLPYKQVGAPMAVLSQVGKQQITLQEPVKAEDDSEPEKAEEVPKDDKKSEKVDSEKGGKDPK
jgi:hypothetical protein